MNLTRRGWGTVGCGVVLASIAVVLANPLLLVAAGGVGAWLLGVQYGFLRELRTHRTTLDVVVDTTPQQPMVDDETTVTVSVQRHPQSVLPLRVALPLPAAIDGPREATVDVGMAQTATNAATGVLSVAGTYRVGPPRITITDPLGIFLETFELDTSTDITVRSRRPETVHLGQGGKRMTAAFGNHQGDHSGPGIEPAELRAYQPGDELHRIDWKATARLNEPYVVESEAETDRRTVLLLDHRASMGIGRSGETPLAYLRHAALALVESAQSLDDPLGLYTVGDAGVTTAEPPRTMPGQYDTIVDSIRRLRPTAPSPDRTQSAPAPHSSVARSQPRVDGGSAANATAATRAAGRLTGGTDQFAQRLQPLLSDATPYIHRVETDPLFTTAKTYLPPLQGSLWTVLITDDTRRGELRETVKLARRSHDHVLVMLTPRALFEPDGLTDLDRAYRQYAEFESFRQELAAFDRVTAFELGPGDRIDAILNAGADRS